MNVAWQVVLNVAGRLAPSGPQLSEPNALPGADGLATYHHQAQRAAEEVLSLPEFADLRSDSAAWWIALLRWLSHAAEAVATFFQALPGWLWWTIVIWMILTLVAIFAHFAYVLYGLLVSSASRWKSAGETGKGKGELFGIRDLDFDAVYRRARELLAVGEWSQATRYLYVAAILWLDRQGWLSFKVSKTNYDYLAELARQPGHRAKFGELTQRFESTVYGGQASTAAHCQQMASLVEVLLREATPVVAV